MSKKLEKRKAREKAVRKTNNLRRARRPDLVDDGEGGKITSGEFAHRFDLDCMEMVTNYQKLRDSLKLQLGLVNEYATKLPDDRLNNLRKVELEKLLNDLEAKKDTVAEIAAFPAKVKEIKGGDNRILFIAKNMDCLADFNLVMQTLANDIHQAIDRINAALEPEGKQIHRFFIEQPMDFIPLDAEETKEAEPSETPAPTEVDKEGNGWHHCGADAAVDDGLETYTPVISK